ncbi:hypothetical protein D3C75_772130 [compost metagenome]
MKETVEHPERVGFRIIFRVDCRWFGKGVMSLDAVFLPEFRVKTVGSQMFMLQP